jgi:acyl-homoserine-lactone acylase
MKDYLAAAASLVFLLTSTPAHARQPQFHATITRTTYGIPHIRAKDWAGAGYGVGYAYAQDNLCMLAEEFATVAGERSLYFGPKGTAVLGFEKIDNLTSDVFFRTVIDLAKLRAGMKLQSAPSRGLLLGYLAGYNRLLRDVGPAGVPKECRGKPWVRPITADDMLRLNEKQMLLASSLAFAPYVAGAAPPGTTKISMLSTSDPIARHDTGIGSNGWAFGGDVTTDGHGVLVGNPHFPWNGASRFYQMHITIPDQIDVMGASIAGGPIVSLGFNHDIAWTHTVTAAQHFTVFELKLDPANPTRYLVERKPEAMRRRQISVPMPDGAAPVVRTMYSTRFGPVVSAPPIGLSWSATQAFALRDANSGNQRSLATWIAIGQAKSVGDIRKAVEGSLGIPWVNTIAADRAGNILHADVTAVPNVSAEDIRNCATPRSAKYAGRVVLLDGSKSACDWRRGAGRANLMPASDQAVYARRDYVANSNDSYWLSNGKAPAAKLSPILGAYGTERSLRTRSGLIEIERRFAGTDGLAGTKVDQAAAKAMAFANKSLAAELSVDRLVALCGGHADLAEACTVLQKWDRLFNLESRGAYLFNAFWDKARVLPGLWAIKFDVNDPVHTPRDLVTEGEAGIRLLKALSDAVAKLKAENIALDAKWGAVQFAVRGPDHIPIHGGNGQLGILNVQQSDPVPGGIVPRHGTSYIQVVTFDDKGPVADGLLSYSQSTNPESPHFADQTRAFSAKQWHKLPFSEAEIAADQPEDPLDISE